MSLAVFLLDTFPTFSNVLLREDISIKLLMAEALFNFNRISSPLKKMKNKTQTTQSILIVASRSATR